MSLSRHSRAMLLNVLWHHQGGSSRIGQPIRTALGIDQYARLSDEEIAEAKWIDGLLSESTTLRAELAAASVYTPCRRNFDPFMKAAKEWHGDNLSGWEGKPKHVWWRTVPDPSGGRRCFYHKAVEKSRGRFRQL